MTRTTFQAIASKEELAKASAYRSNTARDLYISGKVLQRFSLSHYEGAILPKDWSFRIREHGKPRVATKMPKVCFNISKTENLIVVAVGLCNIGVDVECLRADFDFENIKSAFSDSETIEIQDEFGVACKDRALQIWTAKEAVVKLDGRGMGIPFRELIKLETGMGPIRVKSYVLRGKAALSVATYTALQSVEFFEFHPASLKMFVDADTQECVEIDYSI